MSAARDRCSRCLADVRAYATYTTKAARHVERVCLTHAAELGQIEHVEIHIIERFKTTEGTAK